MLGNILRFIFYPFILLKNITRPWRKQSRETRKQIHNLASQSQRMLEILAWNARQSMLSLPRYKKDKMLIPHGLKVYSQADEDGIIQEIFRRISVSKKIFIEVGVGDGTENNSLYLLMQGWKGAWIEGDNECTNSIKNKFKTFLNENQLKLIPEWVSKENINQVIYDCQLPEEIDLLSIDVDGNDYHIVESISPLNARVVVLEYNGKFPPPVKWIIKYNPHHHWDGSDYFGASLKSFELLLRGKGYLLVGCNIVGNNAFFVRKDLVNDQFIDNYSAETHYQPANYWIIPGFIAGHKTNLGPYYT